MELNKIYKYIYFIINTFTNVCNTQNIVMQSFEDYVIINYFNE